MNRILVTGAAGKVGQQFLGRFLNDEQFSDWTVRVLCHNRRLDASERVEVAQGDISSRPVVQSAMEGVSHVLHLATCKETPEDVMDVTVKGLFWILEECRSSNAFKQFILLGGDAGMGHFVYPHPLPVTEEQQHSAYPDAMRCRKCSKRSWLSSIRFSTTSTAAACELPGLWRRTTSSINFHLEKTSSAVHVGVNT